MYNGCIDVIASQWYSAKALCVFTCRNMMNERRLFFPLTKLSKQFVVLSFCFLSYQFFIIVLIPLKFLHCQTPAPWYFIGKNLFTMLPDVTDIHSSLSCTTHPFFIKAVPKHVLRAPRASQKQMRGPHRGRVSRSESHSTAGSSHGRKWRM